MSGYQLPQLLVVVSVVDAPLLVLIVLGALRIKRKTKRADVDDSFTR
jgi:hypothetical protein